MLAKVRRGIRDNFFDFLEEVGADSGRAPVREISPVYYHVYHSTRYVLFQLVSSSYTIYSCLQSSELSLAAFADLPAPIAVWD